MNVPLRLYVSYIDPQRRDFVESACRNLIVLLLGGCLKFTLCYRLGKCVIGCARCQKVADDIGRMNSISTLDVWSSSWRGRYMRLGCLQQDLNEEAKWSQCSTFMNSLSVPNHWDPGKKTWIVIKSELSNIHNFNCTSIHRAIFEIRIAMLSSKCWDLSGNW